MNSYNGVCPTIYVHFKCHLPDIAFVSLTIQVVIFGRMVWSDLRPEP